MRFHQAYPPVLALAVGVGFCALLTDSHPGLDAANAACRDMAAHRYEAAEREVTDAAKQNRHWLDLAWAIRAVAWNRESIGPNLPYPPPGQEQTAVNTGCRDAANEANETAFQWSP
jgi:hypothetical protein